MRRRSLLGYILMATGSILIIGAFLAWLLSQGSGMIRAAQLPSPATLDPALLVDSQPSVLPSLAAPVATLELSDDTDIPLVDQAYLEATPVPPSLAAEDQSIPVLPTIDFAELPSEATAEDAPRRLREPQSGQPLRLIIPVLGVDAPIRDVGLSSLEAGGDIFYQWQVPHDYAVGWHHTSAPLGMPGNTVLNGHHNVFGEVFRELETLAVGDGIVVQDNGRNYVYIVDQKEILPERGQSIDRRQENSKWIQTTRDERLTLVTCWPYTDNSHRLVIVAKRIDG